MTGVLIGVTIMSLAMAAALLAYLRRLTRQERERSAARVAALVSELDAARPGNGSSGPSWARSGIAAGSSMTGAAVERLAGEAGPSMFETSSDTPGRGRLAGAVGAGALLVCLVLAAVFAASGGSEEAVPPGVSRPPLELLSLRHDRGGNTLTISGLVRNPGESPVDDVTASVAAFDRAGTLLATGESPVDAGRLAPGGQSPFVVRVSGARDVRRYRVTLRTSDGPIEHLDRRNQVSQAVAGRP